jgi:hypothetical protein
VTSVAVADIEVWNDAEPPCRMCKEAVQQGRSEQKGESYSVPYVEPLSDARTPLADFSRILLDGQFGSNRIKEDVQLEWLVKRPPGSKHLCNIQ